jgi:hypothetical protein
MLQELLLGVVQFHLVTGLATWHDVAGDVPVVIVDTVYPVK